MDKTIHRTPRMRRRYNGAKKDEIGRRRAVWEIEKGSLCERYGFSQFLWENEAPGVCKTIAEGMKKFTKDGERLFEGDVMELDIRRNGSSRRGFYFGGHFWTKPPREAVHKVYVEGDVLRLVGPPSLEKCDVSYLTGIRQEYITKRA